MSTITFGGNLAADPEIRFTPSGAQLANFVVLENRSHRGTNPGGVGGPRAQPLPGAGLGRTGRERRRVDPQG